MSPCPSWGDRLSEFLSEVAVLAPTIAVAAEMLEQRTAASLLRSWAAEAGSILGAAAPKRVQVRPEK